MVFNQRTSDMQQNLHLQDVAQDIGNEFLDNPFFNSDLDVYFCWLFQYRFLSLIQISSLCSSIVSFHF